MYRFCNSDIGNTQFVAKVVDRVRSGLLVNKLKVITNASACAEVS